LFLYYGEGKKKGLDILKKKEGMPSISLNREEKGRGRA